MAIASSAVDDVVALVLARGLGRRMREAQSATTLTQAQDAAAAAGLKGMMPIPAADGRARPFLDYVLSQLADAGYTRVGVIVAPESASDSSAADADPLRHYYRGVGRPTRCELSFVVQEHARGTADAVWAAADYVGQSPFVVLNADNLYGVSTLRALRDARGPALPVYARDQLVESSGIPAARVAAFALLTVGDDGMLTDVVEKPGAEAIDRAGPHALISMNCWRGDHQLLAACRDVEASSRGEFELPMAVKLAIRRGVRFKGLPANGPVLDLSRRQDVGAVMERLKNVVVVP